MESMERVGGYQELSGQLRVEMETLRVKANAYKTALETLKQIPEIIPTRGADDPLANQAAIVCETASAVLEQAKKVTASISAFTGLEETIPKDIQEEIVVAKSKAEAVSRIVIEFAFHIFEKDRQHEIETTVGEMSGLFKPLSLGERFLARFKNAIQ